MANSPGSFSSLAAEYRRRTLLCRQLEDKKAFLRQRMVQLRGSRDPAAKAAVPVLNAGLRQLGERMAQEQSRAAAEAHAIDSAIAKLQNERLAQVLHCRYLELLQWDEISELTGLGVRWLCRLNKKALELLD